MTVSFGRIIVFFKTRFVLLITFYCVLVIPKHLDGQEYTKHHLGLEEGLSHGSNYFSFEDSKGFLWISALDAINRYDGTQVKIYNQSHYFIDCPNLSFAIKILEDDHGDIFVGSSRGIYRYLRKRDKFILYPIFKNESDKTAIPIGFHDGKLWCTNTSYKLASIDLNTGIHSNHDISITNKNFINIHDRIQFRRLPKIYADKLYFFTNQHVVYFNIPTKKDKILTELDHIKSNQDYMNFELDTSLKRLLIGHNGTIQTFDLESGKSLGTHVLVREYNYRQLISEVISDKSYYQIVVNEKGYYTYTKDFQLTSKIEAPYYDYVSMDYRKDKLGRVWYCTNGNGLYYLEPNTPILNKRPGITDKGLIKQYGIGLMTTLSDGMIFMNNGIFDPKKNQFKVSNNKGGYYVKDRIPDFYYELNFSTTINRSYLLNYYNNSGRLIQTWKPDTKTEYGIGKCIEILSDGTPLLSFSNGLFYLDKRTNKIKRVENQPEKNPFFINRISSENYVISYSNSDMRLLEYKDKRFRFTRTILPDVLASYITYDSIDKKYWAGTEHGVYLLNSKFQILKKIDANTGLHGCFIYGLQLDDQRNCWVSHQKGLSSIDRTTHQVINFTKEDGLQDYDFNNRAFCKGLDGTLYFGGRLGFNYFKPPLTIKKRIAPKIYLDEILIKDKQVSTYKAVDYITQLHLAPHQNTITLKTSILDLEDGKNQYTAYRINQSSWIKLPSKQPIVFSQLESGTYNLELGVWNRFHHIPISQKKITFTISQYFYKTPWFWTMISILIGLIGFYYYARKKNAQFELQWRETHLLQEQRNKITADLHDDLGATLSSFHINTLIANKYFDKKPQQAKDILVKLEEQIANISERLGDFVWSLKTDETEFMTLSTRIRNYISEVFTNKNMKYTIDIDNRIDHIFKSYTERKNIIMIVKEVINNALKYSQGSIVQIQFHLDDRTAFLSIIDDGIGFDMQTSKGNGINHIKMRVKELNGHLNILSSHNKGTKIHISIPLPNNSK